MVHRSTSKLDRSAGARATQRSRLIAGLIAVANRDGYAASSVSAVIADAKISKPTFYEYFRDREDCFIAAIDSVHTRLLDQVAAAVAYAPPEQAATAAARALLEFAGSEPALMRFITSEALAGTRAILDARDEGIAEIAGSIENRLNEAPPDAPTPDLGVVIAIGGLYRLVGARARSGEHLTDSEIPELLQWIGEYNVPRAARRWHTMQPSMAFASLLDQPASSLRAPEPLPPGRPTLSDVDVAANQRLRIIFAAGILANEKGYAAVTVNEIAKRAQVDLRVFYSLFAKKQDVFFAAQEHGFQEAMAVAAAAFFAGATWPERCWAMCVAFHRFLDANPQFAQLGFIEAYAAGHDVAQRTDESLLNATIFIQEGLQFSSKSTHPTRTAMHAMIFCNLENIYRRLRTTSPKLIEFVPNTINLWLTPFLGPVETNRFIDEQTAL
jgi:AcrR family transcriptional regulator